MCYKKKCVQDIEWIKNGTDAILFNFYSYLLIL